MRALSVVIPTLGRWEFLDRVLDRLAAQRDPGGEIEAIVVEDARAEAGGPDDAPRRPGFAVRRLRATVPGASAARNAGWRAASAPVVLFLDDDILPDERLVAEHLRWHARHPEPEVGVLGHVRWARELRVTPFMRWLELGVQFDYGAIEGVEAGWGRFYTCNASVKRALLERVEGFDEERLPFGYEDLDLASRMAKHGFRLLYNRRARAEHLRGDSIEEWADHRAARIARSERRFVAKHPDVRPYFHDLFSAVEGAPRRRSRAELVARFVPPGTPLVGRPIWDRVATHYRQVLAPVFLDAWERSEREHAPVRAAERQ